ncbi:hypothetical protein Tco_0388657 [Tanacetum coccineum]
MDMNLSNCMLNEWAFMCKKKEISTYSFTSKSSEVNIYCDLKRKPMEFQVGDRVMLKVSPWKGVKCYSDEPLLVPLEGLNIDDKIQFVEEPVEIMEREIKRLKRSRIPLVKICWNSRRGPEFTWEREDSFKKKYPHLFTNRASSSTTTS